MEFEHAPNDPTRKELSPLLKLALELGPLGVFFLFNARGEQIAAACPDGIDVYFENVGGRVLEGILPNLNVFGRMPICGMIAYYDGAASAERYDLPKLWRTLLVQRAVAHGFIISDHWDKFPAFLEEVAPLVANGTIKYTEDVAEGLENAPETFMSMLKGGNFGKQVVKIA